MRMLFAVFRARQDAFPTPERIFFSSGIRLRQNGVTVARQLPIRTGIHLRNDERVVRLKKGVDSGTIA